MIEESGLQRLSGADGSFETFDSVLSLNAHGVDGSSGAGSVLSNAERKTTSDVDDTAEELPDIMLLDTKISETEAAIKEAEKNVASGRGQVRKLKELRERREDLLRLKRVEQIYVSLMATG